VEGRGSVAKTSRTAPSIHALSRALMIDCWRIYEKGTSSETTMTNLVNDCPSTNIDKDAAYMTCYLLNQITDNQIYYLSCSSKALLLKEGLWSYRCLEVHLLSSPDHLNKRSWSKQRVVVSSLRLYLRTVIERRSRLKSWRSDQSGFLPLWKWLVYCNPTLSCERLP